MALSSLNPRLLSSFSSSRRSQRFCDSAKSVEVSQSREHCPLVRGGMQGLNTNPVLHRLMNTVQVEQPWRRSCPLALHTSLLPTKMITLRKHCRGADGADNHHACFHDSIDGHLPQKESMNTSMTCHAQIHFEPSNMDDKALPSLQLSSLSERGREGSNRLASAVGLIMGTAVGPGILGLPAATLHAGLIPSTVIIVGVWAYVMASILLVAELSYAVMAEQGGAEVSFTGLAVRTLGHSVGRVVALVYAFLNYALLVACVAGLHSILAHWLPLHPTLVCILSPGVVVSMLAFTSFQAVDTLNRALCGLMLASITGLVGIGISIGRIFWLGSMGSGTWSLVTLSPAIPAEEKVQITQEPHRSVKMTALLLAMAPPVAVAMTSPTAFSSALDFAGLYANCFLFGVLPPIMAWVYRYQQPQADQVRHTKLVPGGRVLLLALFLIAVYLGLKPPNTRM